MSSTDSSGNCARHGTRVLHLKVLAKLLRFWTYIEDDGILRSGYMRWRAMWDEENLLARETRYAANAELPPTRRVHTFSLAQLSAKACSCAHVSDQIHVISLPHHHVYNAWLQLWQAFCSPALDPVEHYIIFWRKQWNIISRMSGTRSTLPQRGNTQYNIR